MEGFIDSRILPIGGGKGGIGKSLIIVGIGSILAQHNRKIIFVDADLGGANLHLLLGIRYPALNLSDFINGRKSTLNEILLETPVPGAKLISGASDILGLANPRFAQKEKMIRGLRKLESDYVLLDLGAGTNFNTIDFFALSNKGIIVVDPELTTIENAYGFVKTSILRKIQRLYSKNAEVAELVKRSSNPRNGNKISTMPELLLQISRSTEDHGQAACTWLSSFRPRLIVNRVRKKEDVDFALRFCDIAKKYLNVEILYVGYVAEDPVVRESVRSVTPLFMMKTDSVALNCLKAITSNLLELEKMKG